MITTGLASVVRERVAAEIERRAELVQAVSEAVKADPAIDAVPVSANAVRRHLSMYYGKELAEGATIADLAGAIARIGGIMTSAGFVCVELVKPSREARLRIAEKWNKGLPAREVPLIRRGNIGAASGASAGTEVAGRAVDGDEFVDVASLPPGTLYRGPNGVYRQVTPESAAIHRDGGVWNKRGQSVTRKRRFPSYLAKLREFLDKEPGTPFAKVEAMISAVDRQILEYVIEGQTLRWIADEMGMKKPTVYKRVAKIRREAGISGPGPGR